MEGKALSCPICRAEFCGFCLAVKGLDCPPNKRSTKSRETKTDQNSNAVDTSFHVTQSQRLEDSESLDLEEKGSDFENDDDQWPPDCGDPYTVCQRPQCNIQRAITPSDVGLANSNPLLTSSGTLSPIRKLFSRASSSSSRSSGEREPKPKSAPSSSKLKDAFKKVLSSSDGLKQRSRESQGDKSVAFSPPRKESEGPELTVPTTDVPKSPRLAIAATVASKARSLSLSESADHESATREAVTLDRNSVSLRASVANSETLERARMARKLELARMQRLARVTNVTLEVRDGSGRKVTEVAVSNAWLGCQLRVALQEKEIPLRRIVASTTDEDIEDDDALVQFNFAHNGDYVTILV